MNNQMVFLNGAVIPMDQAKVSVLDRGFLFGDGVYEVIPVYGSRPFRLTEHLDRLQLSLDGVRIRSPYSNVQWEEIFHQLIRHHADDAHDLSIYLQITRGVHPKRDHAFPVPAVPTTVFVMCNPVYPVSVETLEKGVAALTLPDVRWKNCHLKTINLLANILLRQEAVDDGAYEAILVRDGCVTEGAASNLFIVKENCLITPPKSNNLLPGITRDLVLELAIAEGVSVAERDIAEAELDAANEIWLTSSTKEILPVTQLNHKPVANGKPGDLWRKMDRAYKSYKASLV